MLWWSTNRGLNTATLPVKEGLALGRWHVKVLAYSDTTHQATVRVDDTRCSDNRCALSCISCVCGEAIEGWHQCCDAYPQGFGANAMRPLWDAIPYCYTAMEGRCWAECPAEAWQYVP
jgi:hypothetical protein